MKKNDADNYDSHVFYLDENAHPIAYQQKLEELLEVGMTEKEARNFILTTPFEMELYYSKHQGLFFVESEAVEAITMFNPYDGTEMEEDV